MTSKEEGVSATAALHGFFHVSRISVRLIEHCRQLVFALDYIKSRLPQSCHCYLFRDSRIVIGCSEIVNQFNPLFWCLPFDHASYPIAPTYWKRKLQIIRTVRWKGQIQLGGQASELLCYSRKLKSSILHLVLRTGSCE